MDGIASSVLEAEAKSGASLPWARRRQPGLSSRACSELAGSAEIRQSQPHARDAFSHLPFSVPSVSRWPNPSPLNTHPTRTSNLPNFLSTPAPDWWAGRALKGVHLILLLALNCGWAALPVIVTRLESELGPLEFVSLRYGFAFLALAVVWPWLPGTLPRGRDFWKAAAMGVIVFTIGHQLQIHGMQGTAASDAAILLVLDPLVSSLGAALFLHEHIPGKRWLGFALAITGVSILSLWHKSAALPGLVANLLIILSFISEAVWSVMGKPLVTRWDIPKVTAVALGAGTLANFLLLLPEASIHTTRIAALSLEGWVSVAALGIILTAIGYSLWYVVIREVPVSVASMTIYLQPIVATLLAIAVAGETPHAGHAWGSIAIIAGVILGIQRAEK